MDAFYEAAKQLSPPVAAALAALEPGVATAVTEIRLRCQQPVALQTRKGTLYLTKSGHVRMCPASDSFITSFAEIQDCFYAVCGYSVHSVQHALTNGYVPLAGGHRAGVCGTAVLNSPQGIEIAQTAPLRRVTDAHQKVIFYSQSSNFLQYIPVIVLEGHDMQLISRTCVVDPVPDVHKGLAGIQKRAADTEGFFSGLRLHMGFGDSFFRIVKQEFRVPVDDLSCRSQPHTLTGPV